MPELIRRWRLPCGDDLVLQPLDLRGLTIELTLYGRRPRCHHAHADGGGDAVALRLARGVLFGMVPLCVLLDRIEETHGDRGELLAAARTAEGPGEREVR